MRNHPELAEALQRDLAGNGDKYWRSHLMRALSVLPGFQCVNYGDQCPATGNPCRETRQVVKRYCRARPAEETLTLEHNGVRVSMRHPSSYSDASAAPDVRAAVEVLWREAGLLDRRVQRVEVATRRGHMAGELARRRGEFRS